jgi:quercetin dioxygenase-like cupin family protein
LRAIRERACNRLMARGTKGEAAAQLKRREEDETRPVRTLILRRGASSALHRHDEDAAWFHVVEGEIVEERWTRDPEGGYLQEQRRLRVGQSMAAPADALHRIEACEDAVVISTCASDCACCTPASAPEIDAVLRLARAEVDRDWATTTALGPMSPL